MLPLISVFDIIFMSVFQTGQANPRNGRNTDEAHPPIHPTKVIAPSALNNDRERQVYEVYKLHPSSSYFGRIITATFD